MNIDPDESTVRVRHCLLLPALVFLGACAGPLPAVDPQQAWVDLATAPGNVLMADRLDNRSVNDGRYFQVSPGEHDLQVRLQFDVPSGGQDGMAELQTRTCRLHLRFPAFVAGQRYLLKAGQQGYRPWARLYDSQQQVLVRGKTLRCGSI